jgi:hypothetical protein
MTAKRKIEPRKKSAHAESEKRLSPENLKLLREIRELRKSIGPVSRTSTEILRELRGYDD